MCFYKVLGEVILTIFHCSFRFQVKWMMYWIIFALFTTVEVFTDMFLCWYVTFVTMQLSGWEQLTSLSFIAHEINRHWLIKQYFHCALFYQWLYDVFLRHSRLPFYYELKIAFVVWLLSPYTRGSSVLYRKFVHPTLSSKEKVTTIPLLDLPFASARAAQGNGKVKVSF